MTRDNLLFSTIGVLLGFIIGFMFASSMNQRGPAGSTNPASQNLPADHPPIDSGDQTTPGQMQPEVMAQIQAARQNPNDFDAQIRAANLEYRIERYDAAIEFFLKANKLRPDDYDTIVNLGVTNMDMRNYDEAETWYRMALKKQPDDVQVLAGLCMTTLGRGDAKAAEVAIAQLEKVSATSEDLPRFKERLKNLKSGGGSK